MRKFRKKSRESTVRVRCSRTTGSPTFARSRPDAKSTAKVDELAIGTKRFRPNESRLSCGAILALSPT
jgi:hypothetical protein